MARLALPCSSDLARSNGVGTLCMGALGGLYRPTPQGYNGNPVGCRTRLSVSLVANFCVGYRGLPPGGPRQLVWYGADRPLPPLAGLAGC